MEFECKHINLVLSKSFSACICKILPCSVTHLADQNAAETFSDSAITRASQLAQGHQVAKALTAAFPSHCESALCHCWEICLVNRCCEACGYSSTCYLGSVRVARLPWKRSCPAWGRSRPALCDWDGCGACHVNKKIRMARVEIR